MIAGRSGSRVAQASQHAAAMLKRAGHAPDERAPQAFVIGDVGKDHGGSFCALTLCDACDKTGRLERARKRPTSGEAGGVHGRGWSGRQGDRGAPFREPWGGDDDAFAARLNAANALGPAAQARIDAQASRFIEAIRARSGMGGVEDLLHEFALSTAEGVALMMLAEALLRIPDEATADLFIEDKIGQGDWAHHVLRGDSAIASASVWALALARRIVSAGETPSGALASLVRRIGAPAVRIGGAAGDAHHGRAFRHGRTIDEALKRGQPPDEKGEAAHSFDMLGEGARTRRMRGAISRAMRTRSAKIGEAKTGARPEPARRDFREAFGAASGLSRRCRASGCIAELYPMVLELAKLAAKQNINFTLDAEEADRLALSLMLLEKLAREAALPGLDRAGARGAGLSEARRGGG